MAYRSIDPQTHILTPAYTDVNGDSVAGGTCVVVSEDVSFVLLSMDMTAEEQLNVDPYCGPVSFVWIFLKWSRLLMKILRCHCSYLSVDSGISNR